MLFAEMAVGVEAKMAFAAFWHRSKSPSTATAATRGVREAISTICFSWYGLIFPRGYSIVAGTPSSCAANAAATAPPVSPLVATYTRFSDEEKHLA